MRATHTPGPCAVPGCFKPILHGNLCQKHYHRKWHEIRRNGKPDVSLEELAKMVIPDKPHRGHHNQNSPQFHQPLLDEAALRASMGLAPQLPIGRIVTEDDLTPIPPRYESGPGEWQDVPKRSSRKEIAARKAVLHEGIEATLKILHTFYAELKELDK